MKMAHVPQVAVDEPTRLPDTVEYEPLMPEMDTSEPVVAPMPMPETQAGAVVAPVESGIHPPVPKTVVPRERDVLGTVPTPPLHALEQKMQPALQPPELLEVLLQAVGQSAGSAYIQMLLLLFTSVPGLVDMKPTVAVL